MSVEASSDGRSSTSFSKQQDIGDSKSFICPKCKKYFDFQTRGNVFLGRLPLILPCEHTMCEECIRKMFLKNEFSCPVCNREYPVEEMKKHSIQEIFPINYYIFGKIAYAKPQNNVSASTKTKSNSFKWRVDKTMPLDPVMPLETERCCQDNCNKVADLRCVDCEESYCKSCSYTIHNFAKGLKNHKLNMLGANSNNLKLTMNCQDHPRYLFEFFCNVCSEMVCCYCLLHNHKGHDFTNLATLEGEDVPYFNGLVEKAEEMLKTLHTTLQKITKSMEDSNSNNGSVSEADRAISKYFTDLHAKLQTTERNLKEAANSSKDSSFEELSKLKLEVGTSIKTVSDLLKSASTVQTDPENARFNIPTLVSELERAIASPCYLAGGHSSNIEVMFDNPELFDNLEDHFTINGKETTDKYRLVAPDGLPDNFKVPKAPSSISSSLRSEVSPKTIHYKKNKLIASNKDVGAWVSKDTAQKDVSMYIPSFKKNDREHVIVTHINSPESFYVQFLKRAPVLESLQKEINTFVQAEGTTVPKPELNKLYLVKYQENKKKYQWCRARLVEILDEDSKNIKFNMMFIDYGNTKIVLEKDIREISLILAEQAPFAYHCRLYNIFPKNGEWNPKALTLMAQIVAGSQIVMTIFEMDRGIMEVDLISLGSYGGGTCVGQALVHLGHAVLSNDGFRDTTQYIKPKSHVKLFPRSEEFKANQSLSVVICHVQNPHKIFVQASCYEKRIQTLLTDMSSYYEQRNRIKIFIPEKDMDVAVLSDNRNWYRGKITQFTPGTEMVTVFLVDFGKTITVNWSHLKVLTENFTMMECQAIQVKLADIEPMNGTWDPAANTILEEYRSNKTLKMVVKSVTDMQVALFDMDECQEICINALLVKKGLALSKGKYGEILRYSNGAGMTPNKDELYHLRMMRTIQGDLDNLEIVESTQQTLSLFNELPKKNVKIGFFQDPGLFYITFDNPLIMGEYNNLHLQIQNHYISNPLIKKETWQPDELCVVYDEQKKNYYRGSIIEIISENTIKVRALDTGFRQEVSLRFIGELDGEFTKFPDFSIPCHLFGVRPAGDPSKWSNMAIDYMEELINNYPNFHLTKMGDFLKDKCSLPVILWYSEQIPAGPLDCAKVVYNSVNDMLIRNGLALKSNDSKYIMTLDQIVVSVNEQAVEPQPEEVYVAKSWMPPILFKEKKFKATVSNVDDNGTIYLHNYEDNKFLESMRNEMKTYFENTLDEGTNWVPEQVCTAKFSLDDCWYRGKVINKKDHIVNVLFIDYGNVEAVTPNLLRKTIMYESIPAFANKVQLYQVAPPSGKWVSSQIDIIHAELVDREDVEVELMEEQVEDKPTPARFRVAGVDFNNVIKNYIYTNSKDKAPPEYYNSDDDDGNISESNSDHSEGAPCVQLELKFVTGNMPARSIGEKVKCGIISVVNYDTVIFEACEEKFDEDFEAMVEDINKEALEQPLLDIDNLTYLMPCLAKYSDDLWYRAAVNIPEKLEDKIYVWFVDYGNFDYVPSDRLREIKRKWLSFPTQYLAKIDKIKLVNDEALDEVLSCMEEMISQIKLIEVISHEPLKVQIYEDDGTTLTYQKLIDENLIELEN